MQDHQHLVFRRLQLTEEPAFALREYAHVLSTLEVRDNFEVNVPEQGLGGLTFALCAVAEPYVKDYDAYPAIHPTEWAADVSPWGFLAAWLEGHRALPDGRGVGSRTGSSLAEGETQNVNAPACRFYARQGCTLGAIRRFAYPDLPYEAQLLWYKDLAFRPAPLSEARRAIDAGLIG